MKIIARLLDLFKPRQLSLHQMMDRNLSAGRLIYPDWRMYNG